MVIIPDLIDNSGWIREIGAKADLAGTESGDAERFRGPNSDVSEQDEDQVQYENGCDSRGQTNPHEEQDEQQVGGHYDQRGVDQIRHQWGWRIKGLRGSRCNWPWDVEQVQQVIQVISFKS